MSSITRTYTFTDGTTAYGSQVDSEIANIVATWNNHDAGTSIWTVSNALKFQLNSVTAKMVLQALTFTATGTFTTTSSTYQITNSLLAITPTTTSSKILVLASGVAQNSSVNSTIIQVSLFRGTTDIGGGTEMGRISAGTAIATARWGMAMIALDSPASVAAQTYSVKVLSSDNASTVGWLSFQTITLLELL